MYTHACACLFACVQARRDHHMSHPITFHLTLWNFYLSLNLELKVFRVCWLQVKARDCHVSYSNVENPGIISKHDRHVLHFPDFSLDTEYPNFGPHACPASTYLLSHLHSTSRTFNFMKIVWISINTYINSVRITVLPRN